MLNSQQENEAFLNEKQRLTKENADYYKENQKLKKLLEEKSLISLKIEQELKEKIDH